MSGDVPIGRFLGLAPQPPKTFLLGRVHRGGTGKLTAWDVRGLREWGQELGDLPRIRKARLMAEQSKGLYGIKPATIVSLLRGDTYAGVV